MVRKMKIKEIHLEEFKRFTDLTIKIYRKIQNL